MSSEIKTFERGDLVYFYWGSEKVRGRLLAYDAGNDMFIVRTMSGARGVVAPANLHKVKPGN